MEIFEIAAQLGKALKEDERLVRLENAKKAYKESPTLGKMMIEYEVQQKALENEVVKPEKDTHFIDIIHTSARTAPAAARESMWPLKSMQAGFLPIAHAQ